MTLRGFWRWLAGHLDCPRCGEPMRRTDTVVRYVEYLWSCRVCHAVLPRPDRGLIDARKRVVN